jgi:chromosome segregation ATPase
MDPLLSTPQLIESVGLFATIALFAFLTFRTVTIRRGNAEAKKYEADARREEANTDQQKLIVEQFAKAMDEAHALRLRVEKLESEIHRLIDKVASLESEKATRMAELERELLRNEALNRSLMLANDKIAALSERVARLEEEKALLLVLLDKLNIKPDTSAQAGDGP